MFPPQVTAGGEVMIDTKLILSEPFAPSLHVFNIKIYNPDGSLKKCYTRNIKAPNGSANFSIATALNEPVGTYTVKVKDAATGIEAEQKYEIVCKK